MVAAHGELLEPGGAKRVGVVELRDGDLDVDPVLRVQSGHRRRADVVDAQRAVAECGADRPRKALELLAATASEYGAISIRATRKACLKRTTAPQGAGPSPSN